MFRKHRNKMLRVVGVAVMGMIGAGVGGCNDAPQSSSENQAAIATAPQAPVVLTPPPARLMTAAEVQQRHQKAIDAAKTRPPMTLDEIKAEMMAPAVQTK